MPHADQSPKEPFYLTEQAAESVHFYKYFAGGAGAAYAVAKTVEGSWQLFNGTGLQEQFDQAFYAGAGGAVAFTVLHGAEKVIRHYRRQRAAENED